MTLTLPRRPATVADSWTWTWDEQADAAPERIAVIDIGSNSARVVIAEAEAPGTFRVVDEQRASLQLARALGKRGELSERAMAATVMALADFLAIARGAGADHIETVATSAVREAKNRDELLERVQSEVGLTVRVLSGHEEAAFAALGATYGLARRSGTVVDVGGGSTEIAQVAEGRPGETWSFELGALRASDRWLTSDPPAGDEIAALGKEARRVFEAAGIPRLAGEAMIGTGGSVRALARFDRIHRRYPVHRLHGYVLTRKSLRRACRSLAALELDERRALNGLRTDRAESIVGGAVVLDALMTWTGAKELTVAGRGLREGVLTALLEHGLPSAETMRRAAIGGIAGRFSRWQRDQAERRAAIAQALLPLSPEPLGDELVEALHHAAVLLDVGDAIDHYNRHRAAAEMALEADLSGFDHRMLALTASVLRVAEKPSFAIKAYRPLVADADDAPVRRAAALLALADEIHRRTPPGELAELKVIEADGVAIVVSGAVLGELPESLTERVTEALDRPLAVYVA